MLISIWGAALPRCICTKSLYVIRVVFACYMYSLSAQSITTRYLQSIQRVDITVVWRLTRCIKLSAARHSSRCTHRRFQFSGSTCWRRWRKKQKIRRKRWNRKGIQSKPHKIYCPVTQSLNPVGTLTLPVPVAARSMAYVCGRSPAEILGSNYHRRHRCLSVVSVVCCQVEVSATSWSLVQRSPTECGASLCVI